MVDFGSGQGLSVFATHCVAVTATAGIVLLFRKTVNGYAIIAKKRKRRPGLKDAISGWALVNNPWILKSAHFRSKVLTGIFVLCCYLSQV
jgi:hypothetical protein